MTVRGRLAVLAGVVVVGAGGVAATGVFTSALANSTAPSKVVAVDVAPSDSGGTDGFIYAFPAGTDALPAATATTTARSATVAGRLAPALTAPARSIVDAPLLGAVPMQVVGCNASNNNCGLPSCQASDSNCRTLNCLATPACSPSLSGLGACNPVTTGGVPGCGLGNGVNDCFFGLGCGLGGFGLGGCGLFSFSGCGLNLGFGGFGGCGLFGDFGFFGNGDDDNNDSNHRHRCDLFNFHNDFGHFHFDNFHFNGHFSSNHHH